MAQTKLKQFENSVEKSPFQIGRAFSSDEQGKPFIEGGAFSIRYLASIVLPTRAS
jgi:hypothetical protein